MIEGIQKLEPNLLGDPSKQEVDPAELNIAASVASLSVKLLDAVSNIYQIHGNVVRLGANLDILVTSLNNYSRDFSGLIKELQARVDDLEAIKVTELENDE